MGKSLKLHHPSGAIKFYPRDEFLVFKASLIKEGGGGNSSDQPKQRGDDDRSDGRFAQGLAFLNQLMLHSMDLKPLCRGKPLDREQHGTREGCKYGGNCFGSGEGLNRVPPEGNSGSHQ